MGISKQVSADVRQLFCHIQLGCRQKQKSKQTACAAMSFSLFTLKILVVMGVPSYGFNQLFMDCLTSCNNLRIMYNSDFFKFCKRALQIEKLTHARIFDFPTKISTKIAWVSVKLQISYAVPKWKLPIWSVPSISSEVLDRNYLGP